MSDMSQANFKSLQVTFSFCIDMSSQTTSMPWKKHHLQCKYNAIKCAHGATKALLLWLHAEVIICVCAAGLTAMLLLL